MTARATKFGSGSVELLQSSGLLISVVLVQLFVERQSLATFEVSGNFATDINGSRFVPRDRGTSHVPKGGRAWDLARVVGWFGFRPTCKFKA